MSAPPIVRIEALTKRFGQIVAVDQVSLAIRPNEFFALLGPSGCGKTTLLRMLAGFERPSEGRILIDGEEMAGVVPNRRPVNMVFQSYAVFPHMSVAENVAYGLRVSGVARAEIGPGRGHPQLRHRRRPRAGGRPCGVTPWSSPGAISASRPARVW